MLKITDDNINEMVEKYPLLMVYVSAEWCGPCKILRPVMNRLSDDNQIPGVGIGKCNVDDNEQLSSDYKIKSIPTVLVFQNGKEIKRIVGAKPIQEYQSIVDEHLNFIKR